MRETKLKALTKQEHIRAEKTEFIQKLIKKQVSTIQYGIYLYNQFYCYAALEDAAYNSGLLDEIGILDISRTNNLHYDWRALSEMVMSHVYGNDRGKWYSGIVDADLITDSTCNYRKHIRNISRDKELLLAHIYVRHMGDLSGGQIIKRFTPTTVNTYYDFGGKEQMLKEKLAIYIDDKINNRIVAESKLCFEQVIDFLKELESRFIDNMWR